MFWRIARHALAIVTTVLIGGLVSATLVRMAPGFAADERQLDARLSSESIQAIRSEKARDSNIARFYATYLWRGLHGDLGESQTLARPVRELLAERLPVTAKLVALGLALGWLAALGLAFTAVLARMAAYDALATIFSGTFLCVPSAVLALLFVMWNGPAYLAIALVVFPKLYRYARNLLERSYTLPHIITARAKGIGPLRVLFWHVLPVSAAQMLALAGVSVSIALGAAVPVEALCGIPGIGQLAWQAALGRDLPLLVTLTMVVTVVTLAANSGSDIVNDAIRVQEA